MSKIIINEDNYSLEKLLKEVNYSDLETDYIPSKFAIKFINFIKLVNGEEGEENISPLFHYRVLDSFSKYKNNLIVAFRGSSKTTLLCEYLFLYTAVYGELDGFGKVKVAMYVGDTMDNGCKNLRNNIEHRYRNSEFLQKFIPEIRFTDTRLEFTNADNHKLCVKLFGAQPLSLDSTVFLEDGSTTTIQNCKIGDKIYGSDGELATIVLKSDVFYKPTYKIILNDGRSLKVSEDHINPVVEKNPAKPYSSGFKFTNKSLTTLELLGKKLYHGKTKENLFFIPTPTAINYSNKELPLDPYVLGLLLGDGQLKKDGSNNITASSKDMDFYITQIPYELGSRYADKRNSNVHKLSIKNIYKEIEQLGLRGVHTYDKFIPFIYKISSKKQRLELLRGLLDSDGSISKRKLRSVISFSNTSKTLINDVQDVVRSLGGYTTLTKYDEQFRKQPCYKLFIHLNEDVFKLPRKKILQSPPSVFNTMVGIKSIIQIPLEPTQCIGINNTTHQFITTDYIVTHNTGVRGFKEYGERPTLALLDDLFTDKAAESKTIISDIENVIYKAVRQALHPTKRKIVWVGTPFNKKDPLYKAAGSKAWNTLVFPICQKWPCTKKEFVGAWEDRFPYEFVKSEYELAKENGKVDAFNQELLLKILSDDDRLVLDEDIIWYNRNDVLYNMKDYNFYITTDFATSETDKSDYSVISVWALSHTGIFHWVDGICKRQDMALNVDDVFRLVNIYNPLYVGVEISGQQKGFVSWLKREMVLRNVFFAIASDKSSGEEGFRPNTSKLSRFNVALPLFKQRKIAFPKELKDSAILIEFLDELFSVTPGGFKSLHDDCADTVSQLPLLDYFVPHEPTRNVVEDMPLSKSKYFYQAPIEENMSSYIV